MSGSKDIYLNALKRGREQAEAEKLRMEEKRSPVQMMPTQAPKRKSSPVKKMASDEASSSRGNNNHKTKEDLTRIIGEPEEALCLYVIHQASTNSNRCVLKSKSCICLHSNFPRPFVMTLLNFQHGIDDASELADDDGKADGKYLGLQL